MIRLAFILLLIPSLAFATYTEFYCQSGASNLNAGSTNGAVVATQTGDWVSATHIFTPNDGTNPVSLGIAVGMFASVYVTAGATTAVYIARISAVTNATNGATTADLVPIGVSPGNSSGAHTITMKVGGAWLGPNAATGFPFTLANFGNNQDATAHQVRVNLKNDQTYTVTAAFAMVGTNPGYVVQGYTSSVNDGGKATFDGTTNTGQIISTVGSFGNETFVDLIFKTSIGSGTLDLVAEGVANCSWVRCVFTGSRGNGLNFNGLAYECEAYGNNTSNTAAKGGFRFGTAGTRLIRCISHDNTGSNTSGLVMAINGLVQHCVFDTNGQYGVNVTATTGGTYIGNSDFYNNGSDGINVASTVLAPGFVIENNNFIKNTGAGINNVSVKDSGFLYNNGYGAGTQANGSADTLNNLTADPASVTYSSNITPWVDPANGDFRISPAGAGVGTGRGAFTETAASYAGTIGYPCIGAAEAATPTATPTSTATATATSTATSTFTPTATATASFTPCAACVIVTPTPTSTATFTPTATATATATATSTPTATPVELSHAYQG